MGAMKVWDGSAWQTVANAGAPGATVFVGPDAPGGAQAVGNMWYDSDDNTLVTPLVVADGGTGAATVSAARANLGVVGSGQSGSTAGAPTTGTWVRGDTWLDSNDVLWVCRASGSPGTWKSMSQGEELAYNQTTTNTTITNGQASAHLIVEGTTRNYDGGPIIVEVYSTLLQMPANGAVMLNLWDGPTDLGMVCELWNNPTATAVTVFGRRRLVPTVGSHNYRLAAWVNTGSAALYAGTAAGASQAPTYIRVTRA